MAWSYDTWGNRTGQTFSGTSGVGLSQPSQPTYTGHGAGNTTNRADQFTYDNDGNVLADQSNSYLYDAEGRVCAVNASGQGVTLYLYDAEGRRVARGGGSFSCDTSSNGFTPTKDFLLGLDGEQLSEYDGSLHWIHSNVFLSGKLLATYSASGTPLTFALTDWVGTKRIQAKSDGELDTSFSSLPYGDQLTTGTGATEQFFTSKPLDAESGNDYFGARYYASSMGRFLSPDPEQPTPLHLLNPQRWNKYAYALNSPLVLDDPTGKDAAAVNFSGMVADLGHEGIVSIDPDGSAEYARFGPAVQDAVGLWGVGSEPGSVQTTTALPTIQFGADGLPTDASMDALKNKLAQIEGVNPSTVRINYFKTTPQETANLNTWIAQQHSWPNWYNVCSRNCADFTKRGLVAGGAITQPQANKLSVDPNRMFDELEMLAPENSDSNGNAKVTTTECDTLPGGTQRCTNQ